MHTVNAASLKECAITKSSIVSIFLISWRSHLRIRPVIAFTQSRPLPHLIGIEPIFDVARISVASLAYISSPQMFEPWPKWTIDVMILAGEAVLSVVIQWIEFVSPFSCEVKPLSRSVGCSIGSAQRIRNMIVRVCETIKSGIPKRAAICFVVEDSKRQDVRVCT